jgi:uncharacterized membrane protein YhaH (DUF805 family)
VFALHTGNFFWSARCEISSYQRTLAPLLLGKHRQPALANQFLKMAGFCPLNSGQTMGSFSIFHWLILIVTLATWIVPPIKILSKAGYSGWWVLLLFVPLVNIIVLWVFAFADWPILAKRTT